VKPGKIYYYEGKRKSLGFAFFWWEVFIDLILAQGEQVKVMHGN
jgi:hypothetical protein